MDTKPQLPHPPEVVQHEYDHTHPKLTAKEEHEERVNGTMDKQGRRLPAYYLELLIFALGILLVGFYVLLIHPLLT